MMRQEAGPMERVVTRGRMTKTRGCFGENLGRPGVCGLYLFCRTGTSACLLLTPCVS